MNGPGQAILLRIFIDEEDRWNHEGLHMALLKAAKDHGLAGGTVLRCMEGFGAHSRIHTTHIVDISPNLPLLVEIVDDEATIDAFLPIVQEMVREGLVTWQPVNVLVYRHRGDG
jgi:PII-like signaling protein